MRRARRSRNTQLFALRGAPPRTLSLRGRSYRLARVFKHDFYAATCLYEAPRPAAAGEDSSERIVVKFCRRQPFLGLPLAWLGGLLRRREEAIYAALAGLDGVPRWLGRVEPVGYAVEYIDARPLDQVSAPPPGFFDRLRDLFEAIHARGVAYGDANKRSNILIGTGEARGRPFLIDYQISVRRRADLPWPLRALLDRVVRYLAHRDLYHLYKHKRRLAPQELTAQEAAMSRRRGVLHGLHRALLKPYHAVRRRFLRRQYQSGRLISPTADLEDRDQPEKATWRVPRDKEPGR